jgi:isopentenyl phosphate kinase
VHDKNGEVIKDITTRNKEEVLSSLAQTKGFDVTGGMRHKIEEALKHSKNGIQTYIGRVTDSNTVDNIAMGNHSSGTIIC